MALIIARMPIGNVLFEKLTRCWKNDEDEAEAVNNCDEGEAPYKLNFFVRALILK